MRLADRCRVPGRWRRTRRLPACLRNAQQLLTGCLRSACTAPGSPPGSPVRRRSGQSPRARRPQCSASSDRRMLAERKRTRRALIPVTCTRSDLADRGVGAPRVGSLAICKQTSTSVSVSVQANNLGNDLDRSPHQRLGANERRVLADRKRLSTRRRFALLPTVRRSGRESGAAGVTFGPEIALSLVRGFHRLGLLGGRCL